MSNKFEQRRKKAALVCSKKLEVAADAVNDFLRACRECDDGSGDHQRGISDGRQILIRDMSEYAGFLSSKYSTELTKGGETL